MAQINNTQLSKEMIEGAKINTSFDAIPTQLAEKVVPVMEVNPKLMRRINIVRTISAAGTVYTTPADVDFYLTNSSLTGVCTAVGAMTLTITPKGEAAVAYSTLPLSADVTTTITTGVCNMQHLPILLERGSVITAASSGTFPTRIFKIMGYTTEQG